MPERKIEGLLEKIVSNSKDQSDVLGALMEVMRIQLDDMKRRYKVLRNAVIMGFVIIIVIGCLNFWTNRSNQEALHILQDATSEEAVAQQQENTQEALRQIDFNTSNRICDILDNFELDSSSFFDPAPDNRGECVEVEPEG